jgi:YgiT-type zinc finger domain-containing protein
MAEEKKKKTEEISTGISEEVDDFFQDAEKNCNACGGTLKKDKVNLEDFEGGKVYLIENVPALVCEECGEVWVPEESMQEFEEMIETVKRSRKEKEEARQKGESGEKNKKALRPAKAKARRKPIHK